MISIFFDLETSTTNPIGQILNYSFIATDDDFNIIDECFGDVKISPLELPEPQAILANRINVIEHQNKNPLNEMMSMKKIYDFFLKMIEKNRGEAVTLIGYNSSKFDVPFLRTSMIRNGLSPYFGGKIIYKDLLFLVRKLSCLEKKFKRTSAKDSIDKNKLSLTLETTCQNYNILIGKQLHSSRDDVILTINLTKELLKEYDTDIRKFNGYEISYSEHFEYKNTTKIFTPIFPEYDLTKENIFINKFYLLLDFSNKYSLWIDLDNFNELKESGEGEKKSIRWFNFQASSLFKPKEKIEISEKYKELSIEANKKLSDINLENYFSPTVCDIEQDIYRLSLNSLDLLHNFIWDNGNNIKKETKNKELNIVLSRWKLANTNWENVENTQGLKYLKMYADYRYGKGKKLLLNKIASRDSEEKEDFHKSFFDLMSEIESLEKEVNLSKEDAVLLDSLKKFYKESYISKFFI